MIAEISNTFGERHSRAPRGPGPAYVHAKGLHVSPFLGLDLATESRSPCPGDEVSARIDVRGRTRPLTAVLHASGASDEPDARRSCAPRPTRSCRIRSPRHPPAGAAALAEARAVPPQASVRPGKGSVTADDHGRPHVRPEPGCARLGSPERVADRGLLDGRARAASTGGTLVARFPTARGGHFGVGARDDGDRTTRAALIRRVATRGSIGLGEAYQAGEWRHRRPAGSARPALPNADAAVERHRGWWRAEGPSAPQPPPGPARARGATSSTTTTSATTCSRCSSTRR